MKQQRTIQIVIATLILLVTATTAFAAPSYPNCPQPSCGHANRTECQEANPNFPNQPYPEICTNNWVHWSGHHNPHYVTPCECECCKITHTPSNTLMPKPDTDALLHLIDSVDQEVRRSK